MTHIWIQVRRVVGAVVCYRIFRYGGAGAAP